MATIKEIFPSDSLLWLEFGGQYDYTSQTNVVVDSDMEATTTVAWTAISDSVISKQTTSPLSGIRCLRVASAVNANPYCTQTCMVLGSKYVVSGWFRSDGAKTPRVGFVGPTGNINGDGTTSTSWQYFSISGICNDATVGIYLQSVGSGAGYCEFDNVTVYKVIRVIDNLAQRADAPKTVTCGNGVTSTTFPTQLAEKRGVSFDGGDYIDCGLIDRFERTDAFTIIAVVSNMSSNAGRIITTWDTAQDYKGICFGNTTNINQVYILNKLVGIKYIGVSHTPYATITSAGSLHSRAMTYSGSSTAAGVSLYHNGGTVTKAVGSDTLDATIKSGNPILIGGQTTSGVKSGQFTGNMHFIGLFPFAASPLQISNLHKRVLKRINLS